MSRCCEIDPGKFRLVLMFPDLPWEWHLLSRHPHLDFGVVAQLPDKPWSWKTVSAKSTVDIPTLRRLPREKVQWVAVCCKIAGPKDDKEQPLFNRITPSEVEENFDLPWEIGPLSRVLSPHFKLSRPDLPWDWTVADLDFVLEHWSFDWSGELISKDLNCSPLKLVTSFAQILFSEDSDTTPRRKECLKQLWNDFDWWHISKYIEDPDYVTTHRDFPWKWRGFATNKAVTFDFILSHPDVPWYWLNISGNPNLTLENVLSLPEVTWDWESISWTAKITARDVRSRPDLPWDLYYLSQNSNVDLTELHGIFPDDLYYQRYDYGACPIHLLKLLVQVADWEIESKRRSSLEEILKNPDLPWIWTLVSSRSDLTVDIFEKYREMPWDWKSLWKSGLPISYLTECDIFSDIFKSFAALNMEREQHPQADDISTLIDIKCISERASLDIVLKYLNFPWDWRKLSSNQHITLEQVLTQPQLPWDFQRLLCLNYGPFNEMSMIRDGKTYTLPELLAVNTEVPLR